MSEQDAALRARLRRMQWAATGLLAAMAAVFAVVGVMLSVWLWREQDRS